jgi:hypothetical protein
LSKSKIQSFLIDFFLSHSPCIFSSQTSNTQTMSMNAVEQTQATLDQFQQEIPEGAYLKMCNCVKELHHVTKL